MLTFYSDRQALHAPARELNNGEWMDFAESTDRPKAILKAIGKVLEPSDHGDDAILAVHDADYLAFLKSAHDLWLAQGRSGDAIGYTYPVRRRRKLDLERIDGRLGLYGFDAATPIASGTFEAAYWGAQTALDALEAIVTGGENRAFALCRPPGHHAGRDYCGGYCYFNNAAIVAQQARLRGLGPVAILDVDYHHGNGTQDIFYEDGDVFFASIHADPAMDYPYYWGHADERGEKEGEGTTLNLPLPRGTAWLSYESALSRALDAIAAFGARFLIVSYGADTFDGDPISHFALQTEDMQRIGSAVAALGLPTVAIMEGGYNIEALGENVSAFLSGLESG
ncbi:MAG: histone deacetylase family protein [Erythrobacter sp.]|nr:histone deacetylase family protein [Erythrobacter sp.]